MEIKNGMSKDLMEDLSKEPFSLFVSGQELFIFDQRKNCIYQIEPRDLRNILQDRSIRKISHGLKDRLFSLKEIRLEGLWFDTEIAAYLVDSSLSDYSVAALASHYLGRQIVDIPAKFMPYFIYQLYKVLSVKLEEKKLTKLFFETEMPLVSVLRDMEVEGLRVDAGVLCDLSREVDKRAHAAETKIFEMAGKKFNLNSPKQLASILFGELKIPPLKKTKTGYSTNEEVLEKLALQYPIAEAIMEYRYLNKLKTTYIIPLIEDVEKSKGRLYARFNQTATGTGRLSSSSPNLQSIPIKGELSFWLRRAFIPTSRDGYILSGDYSQIELRILAHLSGDSNLVAAFKQDLDIHQFTATLLFGVNKEEVTVQQRDIAKRVNFGIIYGMSSYGLSKELKIAPIEAQNFIDDYFNRYPKVKEYIERIQQLAEKDGFVGTILGRQRPLAEINSPNVQLREFAHRQAVNAPIQGSCADLIKVAMVRIYSALKQKKLNAKLIIQIHDELIFDVPGEELDQVEALVKKHMEEAIALKVPIRVNIAYGKNWGELKAIA
jgi:DNA polymerase-1